MGSWIETPQSSMEIESKIKDTATGKDFWTEDSIKKTLEEHKSEIRDYAYITQDQCTDADGKPIDPHIHLLLLFPRGHYKKPRQVVEWFGLGASCAEKIKSGWSSAVAYLTHANAPEKHQYPIAAVRASFDVEQTTKEGLERKKQRQQRQKLDDDAHEIFLKILHGDIREFNRSTIPDEIRIEYSTKIDRMFGERMHQLENEEGDKQMECIYCYGDSGTGKTTWAKNYCHAHNLSFKVSSSSNDVLDGYAGQDALILDDLRPSCMGLSDLLKMLDNNTRSSVKSRYKNKVLECKVIIVTTTRPIDEFFSAVFEHEDETKVQLLRRCKTRLRFTQDHIYMALYDPALRQYASEKEYANPCAVKYKPRHVNDDDYVKRAGELGLGAEVTEVAHTSVPKATPAPQPKKEETKPAEPDDLPFPFEVESADDFPLHLPDDDFDFAEVKVAM